MRPQCVQLFQQRSQSRLIHSRAGSIDIGFTLRLQLYIDARGPLSQAHKIRVQAHGAQALLQRIACKPCNKAQRCAGRAQFAQYT